MAGLRVGSYRWQDGSEALLRWGPDIGPTVVAVPALHEEANRTRAAMVDTLRRIATAAIGVMLPDLPCTGESRAVPPDAAGLLDAWDMALAACVAIAPPPVFLVAWRGGALIGPAIAVTGRWHLAPPTGAQQAREWRRLAALGGSPATSMPVEAIGRASLPAPARTVRLVDDPGPADHRVAGRPLWRASEPATDAAFQAAVAEDIVGWVRRCAG